MMNEFPSSINHNNFELSIAALIDWHSIYRLVAKVLKDLDHYSSIFVILRTNTLYIYLLPLPLPLSLYLQSWISIINPLCVHCWKIFTWLRSPSRSRDDILIFALCPGIQRLNKLP